MQFGNAVQIAPAQIAIDFVSGNAVSDQLFGFFGQIKAALGIGFAQLRLNPLLA